MPISLSTGLLILRLVAGLTLAAHGAQMFFGWFGGRGISGTLQMQGRLGLKPAPLWAGMAILGEFGGGLSVAFGFLTPLGAAGMFAAMFMAIAKGHWKNGFWNSKRGIEFPLILLAVGVAIGIMGTWKLFSGCSLWHSPAANAAFRHTGSGRSARRYHWTSHQPSTISLACRGQAHRLIMVINNQTGNMHGPVLMNVDDRIG